MYDISYIQTTFMKLLDRTPLPELKQFYIDEINQRTTVSAKKSCLTRLRKQVVSFRADLVSSLERVGKGEFGWLHGERVGQVHVAHADRELEIIDTLYKSLVA